MPVFPLTQPECRNKVFISTCGPMRGLQFCMEVRVCHALCAYPCPPWFSCPERRTPWQTEPAEGAGQPTSMRRQRGGSVPASASRAVVCEGGPAQSAVPGRQRGRHTSCSTVLLSVTQSSVSMGEQKTLCRIANCGRINCQHIICNSCNAACVGQKRTRTQSPRVSPRVAPIRPTLLLIRVLLLALSSPPCRLCTRTFSVRACDTISGCDFTLKKNGSRNSQVGKAALHWGVAVSRRGIGCAHAAPVRYHGRARRATKDHVPGGLAGHAQA